MKTIYQVIAGKSKKLTSSQKAKLPCPKSVNGRHNWGGKRFINCMCGAKKGEGYRAK